MSLETGNYIGALVPANPSGKDPKRQGDDHLRLIKEALLNSFVGFAGAIMVGGRSVGSVNAYELSPSKAMLAYTAGTMVVWSPNVTNTSATPTLNISGLGPRAIRDVAGAPLLAGDLAADTWVAMIDTGTDFRLVGVTKTYIDNLAFTSMLPTPPAGPGPFYLVYQNGALGYQPGNLPDFLLQAQGIV